MKAVAVLGAGTMGHGIAQVCAQAGLEVRLRDMDRAFVDRGIKSIETSLEKGVAKGKVVPADRDRVLARITGTTDLAEACRDADLVIEAVPEDLELKRKVFRDVEGIVGDAAILATNTSSLSIAEIAEPLARKQRFLGLHFFNPVQVMELVEVVRGPDMRADVLDAALAFVSRLGKQSIVVKDSPGFATSRLGVVLGLEAIRMLEDGVASAQDIDKAMELGYRHPMGPLKLSDLVGLDTRLAIADYLHKKTGRSAFKPPDLLRRKVAEGKLGKKTGEGFYVWAEETRPRP